MVCELKVSLKYRGDHVLKTAISQSTINKLVKKQGFAERTTFERPAFDRKEFCISYGFALLRSVIALQNSRHFLN